MDGVHEWETCCSQLKFGIVLYLEMDQLRNSVRVVEVDLYDCLTVLEFDYVLKNRLLS